MTSSGSAYGRFRRALDNGNLLAARAAAVELNHVGLAEALELTLLILAKEPTRFRAAALRWHARYCGDNKVSIEEATAVLGLLAMLEGLGEADVLEFNRSGSGGEEIAVVEGTAQASVGRAAPSHANTCSQND